MKRPIPRTVRFGLLSTYPPTPCRLANYSSALFGALSARGSQVSVVRVADGSQSSDARIVGELVNGSARSAAHCVDSLNHSDVAVIQHDYGVYGGAHGDGLLDVIDGLRVPTVAVAHTILKNPAPHQRWVMERMAATIDRMVVMSEAARERLCREYGVDRRKVVTIPYGAVLPTGPRAKRGSRPTILTCGLLGPGKGVERVIDVMSSLQSVPGHPRYVVAGRTHPKVLARDGEAYREARIEQARRLGVADSVTFEDRHLDRASLAALFQAAAVIVLPYDSTDQVTSGALVDAVASGRPVVATAFPHAVEVLRDGAGILVPHDDPEALSCALRRVLTQPRLAGSLAAEARQLAPAMAWPVVADTYLELAARLLTERQLRV
ncbi:glycosyltransferase [Mycolicibacterium vanbaalenii]|uniref:Glycosyl transferase, group 1 n=1 Tax=Mycolicibacterium vanbaalenii (strain DSM 7251 / JCM 13017 / BCRC 16820 / KCTC 9966 / NRRL B-24157 / PYR-1) TaxID=350058 RepID=A1T3Y0_MYCVP|nr:glycosyltransferase [Mycolicibacterium vanbaalenii]ABM11880.1 glycosyl transferase, group 1 [Mycolicibacterium vanbaalenii PYR-1]